MSGLFRARWFSFISNSPVGDDSRFAVIRTGGGPGSLRIRTPGELVHSHRLRFFFPTRSSQPRFPLSHVADSRLSLRLQASHRKSAIGMFVPAAHNFCCFSATCWCVSLIMLRISGLAGSQLRFHNAIPVGILCTPHQPSLSRSLGRGVLPRSISGSR
ncbi:hypothetical protein VTK26DRAFT_2080 [Humicola hyalothermophila]